MQAMKNDVLLYRLEYTRLKIIMEIIDYDRLEIIIDYNRLERIVD